MALKYAGINQIHESRTWTCLHGTLPSWILSSKHPGTAWCLPEIFVGTSKFPGGIPKYLLKASFIPLEGVFGHTITLAIMLQIAGMEEQTHPTQK